MRRTDGSDTEQVAVMERQEAEVDHADRGRTTETQTQEAPQHEQPRPEREAPTEEETAKKPARPWLKPLLLIIALIVLIVAGIYGFHYYQYAQAHVSTDDAYVTTDVVQITPQVSGKVTDAPALENQHVQKGQLLAVIDPSTFQTAVDEARGNLAQAEAAAQGAGVNVGLAAQTGNAQITEAQGGVQQAQSGIAGAQADVEHARAAISAAEAQTRGTQAGVATAQANVQAKITARQRALDAVRSAQAQVTTAQAGLKAAQAAVNAAQANATRAIRDQQRYATLYNESAVSAQQVDAANAAAVSAQAQLAGARQQADQAQAVIAQRQADLAGAQGAVRSASSDITQARSQLLTAQQDVSAAQANTQQQQALLLAAQQGVTTAQAKRTQALGQLNQAQTAPKQVSVSKANQRTANARIAQMKAALEDAQIALNRTRIVAPTDGILSKKTVEIGQQVAVGQALMSVVPDNDMWVEANFKETQLKNVRPGDKAEIEVDALPGRVFHGHVDSIAAATGATFALLPPDNATGNFTKVVQRLPIKIVLDQNQPDMDRLRGGLSVTATITTK